MTDSFVHLHVHTEYSMLDGAARITPLVQAAADAGMPALAITDHGYLHGAYEFYQAATAVGVKPIIGVEAYVAPGSRLERAKVRWGDGGEDDVSGGGAYTHMTLLATSTEAMHNLFRMQSRASLEGYYFKPRIDRELMAEYGRGLIATTGCASGEIQTRLRMGQYEEAKRAAAELQDIFGKENFFAEIMEHGIDIERRGQRDLVRLARELGMPLLASNDLHYTYAEDWEYQDALLCLQTGSVIDDPKRMRFDSREFYLKSPAEMRALFRELPEACDNTLAIAERCEVKFEKRELMPRFPVPAGETEASWFEKEVDRGMQRRFGQQVPEREAAQAHYEVDVIKQMGFPGYFLVVADFIAWARSQGIRVGPGRGSAAGSIVSYALGITELDPLANDLIFERFLNPDRVSLPDIDVDFDDRRRGEVIRYVTQKYGEDRVAQIATFSTIKAKQALKDAARVLDFPYSVGEKITKLMPPMVMGRDVTLSDVSEKPEGKAAESKSRYREAAELRDLVESDEQSAQVFRLALGLENLKRQSGVHAAGVVMSAEPLIDVVPIMKREEDGAIITQFDQPPLEKLGLLKMDFLGLRNLTVIEDTLALIKANHGIVLELEALDLNADQKTYDLLARGDTLGVFQLDSPNMRILLKQLKPTEFEHISAVIALYRPGPMGEKSHTNYALRKNGLQQIEPIHPELKDALAEILDPTYGLIVYQEQVMAVAQKVAGYSLGQADILRRAMGKKDEKELKKQFQTFHDGMAAGGFSEAAIKELWKVLVPFADYAFNKAHSAGYGVLSYWTAYLKANYTAEYMAALLTSVGDSKDKLGLYLNECRRMGIRVLAPDVNQSFAAFTAVGGDVRFGLGAVRNVGQQVVDGIVSARESKGAFTSFGDFLIKVPAHVCTKRTIESLIKAGAFDALGDTRRSLFEVHEAAVDAQATLKRSEALGQVDLFGGLLEDDSPGVSVPALPEWTRQAKLAHEREMLGLYVSDHPLRGREAELLRESELNIAELLDSEELQDGEVVTVAGLITSVTKKIAKASGKPYASIQLEDFGGEVNVMVLGRTYLDYADSLLSDQVVSLRGRIVKRDDAISLHAQEIRPMAAAEPGQEFVGPLVLRMTELAATREVIDALDGILANHPGACEVQLFLGERGFKLGRGVRYSAELAAELKALLGAEALT